MSSHLAPRFGAPLLMGSGDQLRALGHGAVLGGGRHGLEQGDGLALGPAAADALPDGQRRQRVGESVRRLHGASVGLGGRHGEDLQVLWEGD